MREQIDRLQTEAMFIMLHYHERTGKQKVKDILKRVAGRYVPPKDFISWPTGLIANAFMENYEMWENKEKVLVTIKIYFDRWIECGMPIYYMDDVLCGMALLALYEITGEEKYRTGADKMVNYLYKMEENDADAKGSLPYRPLQKNFHIYVDSIGMVCPFLCKYGLVFKEERAVNLAVMQIKNMLEYGMDTNMFLPYHGYMYESKIKYGIIGWGRAVGWLLMGMADILCFLPKEHPDYRCIKDAFEKVISSTYRYQKENGAFAWQLEATEGPEDSSATAMITSAALKVIDAGIIDSGKDMYGKNVKKAAKFLGSCEKNGRIFACSGECKGFSEYPQFFGAYPWSLGPGLEVLLHEG